MVEKNLNETLLEQQPNTKALVDLLVGIADDEDFGPSAIYHQFPLYLDESGENAIRADLLFVSQKHGVLIFEATEPQARVGESSALLIVRNLSRIDRLLYAKLLKDAPLLQLERRGLKVDITPVIFVNRCDTPLELPEWQGFEVVTSEQELRNAIRASQQTELLDEEYKDLLSTIEGAKGIVKPASRRVVGHRPDSKGAILDRIESEIYNFDREQKRAANFTIDGAQRIRGLAGSGKTIILAMKTALIHLQQPSANILYTYYTKALQDLIKTLITRFYRQFAEKDPDWTKIRIMHAWGGRGLEGVYYNTCLFNQITPLNLSDAKRKSRSEPFEYICEELTKQSLRIEYDYSLLDEAQDFPASFYRLCRKITRNNRVIWAYDDFQNILDIEIQDEKETFGRDANGVYYVDFGRSDDQLQDIVLHRCYRNPRKILMAAVSLGLGIYNVDNRSGLPKIVQRLENNRHWEDLGFEVESGDSSVGSEMIVSRPLENSPLLKNELLDGPDAIRANVFASLEDECSYVVRQIEDDIRSGLHPEDINVVALDNLHVKIYFQVIERMLDAVGIPCFSLLSAPNDNTTYKLPGRVTLSTIFRAKGNEAGSIYIIGVDAIFAERNNIAARNKLFTAITRSLGWAMITGVGENAASCATELATLSANDFKLVFIQPSDVDVRTIQRDFNETQWRLNELEKLKTQLERLGVSDMELQRRLFGARK